MRFLISGQAAAAVSLEAPRQLFRLDSEPVAAPANGDAWRVFDGCSDVVEFDLDNGSIQDALERVWAVDRALRAFLFLIDPQESEEFLDEYAACVEELLSQHAINDELIVRLSSVPFPVLVEVKRVQQAAAAYPALLELFNRALDLQGHIIKVHTAFANLSDGYFESETDRVQFQRVLDAEGIFSELAVTIQQGGDISFIKLKAASRHLAHREAIAQWAAMLQSGTARLRSGRQAEVDNDADWDFDEEDEAWRPNHGAYEYVRNEQKAIIDLVKRRDLDSARSKTNLLIERQRQNSTSEQIAKTLSLLSKQADLHDVPELQLEWARWATEENPLDPRTFGHLADALITLGNFAEAETALDGAERAGGRMFAEGGRARILRAVGRYEEARERYIAVATEFNDAPDVAHAWMGATDTLKDMGRLDEAIAEYQELTRRWPLASFLWSGMAFVLLEAGRLDEAIFTFGKAAGAKQALNGRAFALRQAGKFGEALRIFDQVIENYPNDHSALCGRAEIFRIKGQHQLALAAYELAESRSPCIPTPLIGRAAVLADLGAFDEALAVYGSVIQRFPYDDDAPMGAIRVCRRMGRFDEALRRADALIRARPFLVAPKVLRAQILQSQGDYEAALTALDVIMTQHPFSMPAVSAKASLLIAMGKPQEVEGLLPDIRPRSQFEWSRFLLRTLALKETRGVGAAASKLERALAQCPFFQQRRSIRNALVSLELSRQRAREARRFVETAPTEVSDVIALHAFAASHRQGHAHRILKRINETESSAQVISLADEIAKRTLLTDGEPTQSASWIASAETSFIMLEGVA